MTREPTEEMLIAGTAAWRKGWSTKDTVTAVLTNLYQAMYDAAPIAQPAEPVAQPVAWCRSHPKHGLPEFASGTHAPPAGGRAWLPLYAAPVDSTSTARAKP